MTIRNQESGMIRNNQESSKIKNEHETLISCEPSRLLGVSGLDKRGAKGTLVGW